MASIVVSMSDELKARIKELAEKDGANLKPRVWMLMVIAEEVARRELGLAEYRRPADVELVGRYKPRQRVPASAPEWTTDP